MKASHPILRQHLFQLNKSVLFFKVDVTVQPQKKGKIATVQQMIVS